MTLTVKNFKGNAAEFMRSRGYAFDKKTGEELSFVRRISGQEFPRFHAYVKTVIASPPPSDSVIASPDRNRDAAISSSAEIASRKRLLRRAAPRNDEIESVIASPPPRGGREKQSSRQDLIINLHLDQKRPSYNTGPAHGGEYGGELIREELKKFSA